MLVGNILSPLIMMLVYFITVTPTGLVMKLLGKDLLKEKKSNKNSYWIEKKGPKSKMKNQF